MTDQGAKERRNRLAAEASPYLLQHAANPVDWYPWGEEAFDRAARENKPVFLSIGYSTCHWCHVMERESFEDVEVAEALNRSFVSVKVDREERPDIDQLYMTVCQALTGAGGWPLTAVLTPDKKPFFVGTYLPKHGRLGRPGLMDVLQSIARAWESVPENLAASAAEITDAVANLAAKTSAQRTLGEGVLETAYLQLARAYDPAHGGFAFRPKFPTPHNMSFLLRYAKRYGEGKALEMVEKTLREMRMGGIFDHVGYGFHRYSTDENWLVPHFEKMLYDQALLVMAYVEAFQVTHDAFFANTAREVLAYVLRGMTAPEGGFYSAEDADSEGIEGKFYVWTMDEVSRVLGDEDARLFTRAYNFGPEGNFAEESTGELAGVNIPHRTRPLAEAAAELGLEAPALEERLEGCRQRMFEAREKRVHPLKDDKVLADWNGLMIAAMARAGRVLDDAAFADAARKAADFALESLRDGDGRLFKRWRKGQAALPGMAEDYAFLAWGMIELYEALFDPRYLAEAIALSETMLRHFWDEENGGLFLSPDDGEALPVRAREAYDGAAPSGNSVAALNLLRLARMTGRTDFEAKAQRIFEAFGEEAASRPSGYAFLLMALDFALGPGSEIVITGEGGWPSTREMLGEAQQAFLPNSVLLLREEKTLNALKTIVPAIEAQKPIGGAAAAYICRDFACAQPSTDLEAFKKALGDL